MVKNCPVCNHTGELTWRDGKYHCAMCDHEVPESAPQILPRQNATADHAICPICKNKENNLFDGAKYRCALCGTSFDLHQEVKTSPYAQYSGINEKLSQRVQELKKQKDRNLLLGIVFVVLFWPVSIYFFYKFYQAGKELKALGY